MVFVMRKLDRGPKSLGEKLRDLRRGQAVTLEMMEKRTHIQKRYLVALERGYFHELPEPLYTRNFIRAYTRALSADEDYFIELYEDEVGVCDLITPLQAPRQRLRKQALYVWNHFLRFIALGVLVLAFASYLAVQVAGIISAPEIIVLSPQDDSVAPKPQILVEGIAQKETTVFVNQSQVVVNPDLTFSTYVNLQRGVNTIVIESQRKYSKTSRVTRTIIFDPDTQELSFVHN